MNEKDFTQLNDYFNGLLSPAEAQQVQARAAKDPVFGQEFSLRKDQEAFQHRAAQRQAFSDTLQAVEKDFFEEADAKITGVAPPMTAKVNWGRWAVAVAASVALLLGAFWFFNQSTIPEYRQYAQHAPLSLTVRGIVNPEISKAENAFAAKDFQKALTSLQLVLIADPDNITARLYEAICLIELDRGEAARAVLLPIANGASALRGEAVWYTAISYLKEKNYAACKAALQNIQLDADHGEEAKKLLEKLN